MKENTSIGYLDLVRGNRNFRFLWLGQIVSLLGDWFNLIASAALIGQLTHSGLAVGGLFVVRMLAPFLISPLAGAWADRYNRKNLLILTDILRAITVLGFLLVREPQHVWLLYALTAIQLAISGVFFPTRNAILPDVVQRSELGAANALSSATWSVMLAVGAALGGISAGTFGIYPSFIIDAVTFIVSALILSKVQYTFAKETKPTSSNLLEPLRQYAVGLSYLGQNPDIMVIAILKGAAAFTITSAYQILQVNIAENIFVIGESGGISLGLMYTMVGIGTGIGPIFARRFSGDRDPALRRAILYSYGIASLGLLIVGTLVTFPIVLFGTLLRGFGVGVNWVFSTQLLLQLVPDHVRGRVFATEHAIFTLLSAIGAALGGWMLDSTSLGISGMLYVMAVSALVPGILWATWVFFGKQLKTSREAG